MRWVCGEPVGTRRNSSLAPCTARLRWLSRRSACGSVRRRRQHGDILSDIAAELAGSIGMAASANVGQTLAMFEAVHGSAPDIAGKNVANPSGLLLAALMMLEHLGERTTAASIHNA
ncbi:MAG: isocitrate/isopropylmalate family dehydrogenase, partial [Metallibacterium scheffleri]